MFGRSDIAQRFTIPAGHILFKEGDPGTAAYLIEAGSIDIVKRIDGEALLLTSLGVGELFGEMAIVDGSPRTVTAIAGEESVVLRIPGDLVERKLVESDPALEALVRTLMGSLRRANRLHTKPSRGVDEHLEALADHARKLTAYVRALDDPDQRNKAAVRRETVEGLVDDLVHLFEQAPAGK